MKFLSLSIFLICLLSNSFAQKFKDLSAKMSFPSDLPTPRFIINFPDTVNGISIYSEDIKAITKEKLVKLKDIEFVTLNFSNKDQFEEQVELLSNFPKLKYLRLGDARYQSKLADKPIEIPKSLANYKNIVAISFDGDWRIEFEQALSILKLFPNLQSLFFGKLNQSLPAELREFSQLKSLSIYSNNAIEFPEWIDELVNLESLSIGINDYSFSNKNYLDYYSVLNKIKNLQNLKKLSLSVINRVSKSLGDIKFKSLESIKLDNIYLKDKQDFFDFVTNQSNLKELKIYSTSLSGLIRRVHKLKKLESLELKGWSDTLTIGDSFKGLKRLKSLEISNVKLAFAGSKLPKTIERLDLSSTRLKKFPIELTKLRKLNALNLAYDSLEFLPEEFSKLKNLTSLDLSANRIKSLPNSFKRLTELSSLNIDYNPLQEIPAYIDQFKNLKKLSIQIADLNSIPESIGQLSKLQDLNLNDNFIVEVPASFINLISLKKLDLSYNQLASLPDSIGKLTALEELRLNFNNIKVIPQSIGKLKKLKLLDLGFNNIDSVPDQIAGLSSLREISFFTSKIVDVKQPFYARDIYRKGEPKQEKKLTVNHIKSFPNDLSGWGTIKKIQLENNTGIDESQLFEGLFSIPSKSYSVDLTNCGIQSLPENDWKDFYAAAANFSSNEIKTIPKGMLNAPYLNQLNLNRNKLSSSPINMNQYLDDKAEVLLWFNDLGFISESDLPKTDSMVIALVNKSNNHYYRKEFEQSVKLFNTATTINKELAKSKVHLNNIGEANFKIGNYNTAIEYLTQAIQRDTAGPVRIMNFVIPDFEYRAKSYLALGDTLSAIKDYETLAEKFSDSWGEVGLLYRKIGKPKDAKMAFEKGLEKYQAQIDYSKKYKYPAEMQQLSLLELMIIKEDFNKAEKYAVELEKEFKSLQHITLLRYLKTCASIGSNNFDVKKDKDELLSFITKNKKSVNNWGYELFFKWLRVTKIAKGKEVLMRELTDAIKPIY